MFALLCLQHSLASSSSSFTDLSNDVSLRDHHHRHKVDDRDQVMVMGKKESTLSFFSPFVLCCAHCFYWTQFICLRNFHRPSLLSPFHYYYCSQLSEPVQSRAIFTIKVVPSVLSLLLPSLIFCSSSLLDDLLLLLLLLSHFPFPFRCNVCLIANRHQIIGSLWWRWWRW